MVNKERSWGRFWERKGSFVKVFLELCLFVFLF